MVNVDLPIALAIFLVFLVVTIVFAVNFFSKLPNTDQIQELKRKATDFYDTIFKSKGSPENWENSGSIPAIPGLLVNLRKFPVTVKETTGIARTNEPVVMNITFDEDCINKTWNNSVRVYDSDFNLVASNLTEQNFCSSQFLRSTNVTFNVNISANQNKKFEIYFSDDQNIVGSNYTIIYNTASFVPNDGDSWTESSSDWSRYGGSAGSAALNTSNKKAGTSSIDISVDVNSNGSGLEYNPGSAITGVSNGWYVRAWLFINDTTGLDSINVSVYDGSNIITTNVLSQMSAGNWYLFEKPISSANWGNWSGFNAASIDFIRFFATSSSTENKLLKVDGLRFEKTPLSIVIFPEEKVSAVSPSKVKGMRNISSDEITTVGEGYKFRVDIE